MLARRSITPSRKIEASASQTALLVPLPENHDGTRSLWREAVVQLQGWRTEGLAAADGEPTLISRLERAEAALTHAQSELEAERIARAEVATLLHATEHRLAAVERTAADANQRPALKNFLLELNRRMDMLRARDREVAALTAQLASAERTQAALREELAAERTRREQLELRLTESDHEVASVSPLPPLSARPVVATSSNQAAARPAAPQRAASDAVSIVHLEKIDALRTVVQAAVEKFGHVTYAGSSSEVPRTSASRAVLAINVLSEDGDPWSAIAAHVAAGDEEAPIFAYCIDGERGFIPGLLDYFAEPFDPNTYAARLLCRGAQRVLTVSEHIDGMAMLRTTLSHAQCSTSVVFDAKQALDLLPMVNPDTVLIDLALPKGEAFRLIARLRAEPKTANVRVGVFFSKPTPAAELAQQARRVAQGIPFASSELSHALLHALGPDGLGKDTRAEQKRVTVRDHQAITLYTQR